jgi:hypothetical protein
LNARLIRSEHREGYRSGHPDDDDNTLILREGETPAIAGHDLVDRYLQL